MQGLINFASAIGFALATLLPAFCYLAAITLFLFAGWGFWKQAQPDNPFRQRPWIPALSLVLCGVFATFDKFLTKANVSAGTNLQVTLVQGLTSYTAPTPSADLLGQTPGDAIVNVVQLFQAFFQSFGAMCCFFAILAWRAVVNGQSNRGQTGCGIQFTFGVMLINVLTIAQWLVNSFQT